MTLTRSEFRRAGHRARRRKADDDPVTSLAARAAERIAGGALDGGSVRDLADDLSVSERHLRRCLKEGVGVSPVDLAVAHRLFVAHRLLTDSSVSISRVAYASGFQSLRRFNDAFRDRFRATPREIRDSVATAAGLHPLRVRFRYSESYPWESLRRRLERSRVPGVESVGTTSYARTLRVDRHEGFIVASHDPDAGTIGVSVSISLAPILVELVTRLRSFLGLAGAPLDGAKLESTEPNGQPYRSEGGVTGALNGFGAALATIMLGTAGPRDRNREVLKELVRRLGTPLETPIAGLGWLMPEPVAITRAGAGALRDIGVAPDTARMLDRLARCVVQGRLRFDPGADPRAVARVMRPFVQDEVMAQEIIDRTLGASDGCAT
jgi:AraC family transcriptional regulator, regulatory protein of adaptative response / DNA-3-methyladenine glycosylase II